MDTTGLSSAEQTTLSLLQISLSAAVPLWAMRLQSSTWDRMDARREYLMDMIASHGDNILYRSKKPGGTAEAFNALAEGLAILSFCPGGVKVFGLHFENSHPDFTPDRSKVFARVLEALQRMDIAWTENFKRRHGVK